MYLADRIREFREAKNLSQGDIEHRTGLLRCYISRVENGHTVPALETLEKIARALETPLYQFFYVEEDEPPMIERTAKAGELDWASHRKGYRTLRKFQNALHSMNESDRALLLYMAAVVAKKRNGSRRSDS